MGRYIEAVLRFRAWIIIGCGLLTVLALGIISNGVLASSMLKLFFGQSPEYNRYLELSDRFGATDNLFIAFEEPELFTPASLDRLERISERIQGLAEIRRVESAISAERIRAADDDLLIERYGAVARANPDRAHELRDELAQDPDLGSLLLSKDGRTTAFLLELTNDTNRPVESIAPLLEQVVQAFLAEGYTREQLHMAGLGPETAEATKVALDTIVQIFPFTLFILIVVVFLLFRRVWPVLVTMGVAFISITWTVAFAVLLDRQINLLIAAVPAVMVTVAFSDIIHLCSTYLLELEAGHEKTPAIIKTGREVGLACVWTSVTTFFGFISLVFIPTPVFQQLGLVLGFGVAVALLLALTLVPIFLYYLPAPKGANRETQRAGRLVLWVCDLSRGFAFHNPKATVLGFALLAVVSVLGILRIDVETSFTQRLDPNNRIRKSQDLIRERFAGTNTVDVYVELDPTRSFEEPALIAGLLSLEKELETFPQIDRVVSPANLVARVEQALGVEASARSPESIAQTLLLFEVSGGRGLDLFLAPDRRTVRMSMRLRIAGLVETGEVGRRAAELVEARLGSGVSATPTGITYLFGNWIDFIVQGQRRGMIFALLVTTLLMVLGLRSLRVGVLSMIPNIVPLLVLGGYVGWAWQIVDSDTILVAMIGIGIAVDDTIHFLTRLRIESQETQDPEEALRRTFHFTGSALVQTSIILCLGFLPFALSAYFSTRILGTLLPMTLLVALLADILLLPALVALGVIRFGERPSRSEVATSASSG